MPHIMMYILGLKVIPHAIQVARVAGDMAEEVEFEILWLVMPARRLSLSPPTSLRSAPFKMTLKIVKAPQAHFTSRYGHALELSHRTRNPGLIKTLFVLGSSSILFKSLRLPLHQDTVGPRCFCSLIASILPYLASMLISVPFTLLALRHIDVFANVFRTTTLSCSLQ
ncbi:hypothetical protein C8J57DRAFT_1464221 [Mycena rebaudengoi]|nr:hypothetical protein C8J57DRAFT_1464221 [Mycena rebaudengoi]